MTDLMTTKEAAAALHITQRGVLKLIRERRLKAIWALNKYLIKRDDVDAFIRGLGERSKEIERWYSNSKVEK